MHIVRSIDRFKANTFSFLNTNYRPHIKIKSSESLDIRKSDIKYKRDFDRTKNF